MRLFFPVVVLAALLPSASLAAQQVKQETRELRSAKRELNGDQRDRRQAVRAGDSTAVKQETKEVRTDRRDVRQERRDVKDVVKTKRQG